MESHSSCLFFCRASAPTPTTHMPQPPHACMRSHAFASVRMRVHAFAQNACIPTYRRTLILFVYEAVRLPPVVQEKKDTAAVSDARSCAQRFVLVQLRRRQAVGSQHSQQRHCQCARTPPQCGHLGGHAANAFLPTPRGRRGTADELRVRGEGALPTPGQPWGKPGRSASGASCCRCTCALELLVMLSIP